MSATTYTPDRPLPKEMMEHTYPIFYKVEGSHWWYVGRRRIIAGFLREICAKITDRKPKIADIGCGTGLNVVMLNEFGDVTGVDVSQQAVEFCRERGLTNVKLGEAEKLPFDDETLDIVTAFDVVEHLDDDLGTLKEFRRVLRKDGRILLFVPAFMFLWGVQDDVSNHRRRYTIPQLRDVVERAGFEIERTTYANITFFLPILVIRTLMRWTGIRTETELSIGVSALNPFWARIFGAESWFLRHMNFPFGVSAICVARRID